MESDGMYILAYVAYKNPLMSKKYFVETIVAKAKKEYDGPNTQVASVTLSNASMKEAAMRNFY